MFTDRRLVKITTLHGKRKKHKNEEHSRLPKLIMEAAMFLKMQNFFAFESLIILTAAKRKKM